MTASTGTDERALLPLHKLVEDFVDEYEMRGEDEQGRDCDYTPNEVEKTLILDAIWGLLAEPEVIVALKLGAEQVPAGFALVPLRLTRAMDEVMQVEGWQWSDLLAAAESITSEQYDEISRAPEPTAGAAQVPVPERTLSMSMFAGRADYEKACAAQAPQRCPYCDDTGDVHSIDGEWRGVCSCPAGAAQVPSPWQQIETAPKQDEILAYSPFGGWMVMTWDRSLSIWSDGTSSGDWQPTHWMPLPVPPAAALSQPSQQGTKQPAVSRETVIEWLDALDLEVTDRQLDGLFSATAAKETTQ